MTEWRYEIHVVQTGVRLDPTWYVIDRHTGIRYPWCKWPDEVIALMDSDFDAFRAQAVIVEDVDPERGPMSVYGTWYYRIMRPRDFAKKHQWLRKLLGIYTSIGFELNPIGKDRAEEEIRESAVAVIAPS